MKNAFHTLILLFSFFGSCAYASQSTEVNALLGTWQGQWDGEYKVEFHIVAMPDKQYSVSYHHEEFMGAGMIKQKRFFKAFNANTLRDETILLVANHSKPEEALAIGLFKGMTRIAYLKKINVP